MKILYLEIAGFYIAINFKIDTNEFAYLYLQNKMADDLLFTSQSSIIKKPNYIDFNIDIIFPESIDISFDKTGSLYSKLFTIKKERYIVPIQISLSQLRLIIFHVIQKLLAKNYGFIMHSSSFLIDGKAYLLLGVSGAGKSTSAKLLSNSFPIIGDDSGIIKKDGENYYFYSTPFVEKVPWIRRIKDGYPIGGFLFLKKSKLFKLDKMKNEKIILDKVVNQLIVTDSINGFIPNVIEFVSTFDNFYTLHFAKDEEKLVKLIKTLQ